MFYVTVNKLITKPFYLYFYNIAWKRSTNQKHMIYLCEHTWLNVQWENRICMCPAEHV